MATEVFTAIEIHHEILFQKGHDVHDWADTVGRELKMSALEYAPPRRSRSLHGHKGTGALAASIGSEVTLVDPDMLSIMLYVDADHAKYVLGGTARNGTGYIYSTAGYANRALVTRLLRRKNTKKSAWAMHEKGDLPRGLFMRLPPGPGGTKRYHLRVRGQVKNPFMSDAYYVTRLRHSALPLMPGLETEFSSGYFKYTD